MSRVSAYLSIEFTLFGFLLTPFISVVNTRVFYFYPRVLLFSHTTTLYYYCFNCVLLLFVFPLLHNVQGLRQARNLLDGMQLSILSLINPAISDNLRD